MSSVTDIIDIISYVLIAFIAISLVVSSIMIGVITYISVLERKKEIGILRAIGASKRNISQVFNAETGIIGLCAGLIGIGLSLLLLIPGNVLIHHLAGTNDVSAVLPEMCIRDRDMAKMDGNILLKKEFNESPRKSVMPTEEEIQEALRRDGKASPEKQLNCGACGFKTCRDKAIARCQNKGQLNLCIPYMYQQALSLIHI